MVCRGYMWAGSLDLKQSRDLALLQQGPGEESHLSVCTVCCCSSSCLSCTHDVNCGYCYVDTGQSPVNGSCLPVAHGSHPSVFNNGSLTGRCEGASLPDGLHWAYGYCPTSVAWIVSLGLVTYLIFFAPGQ